MFATFKLILGYFLKGFVGPFFVFGMPFILLLIVGEAYIMVAYHTFANSVDNLKEQINGGDSIKIEIATISAITNYFDSSSAMRALVGGIVTSSTITIAFIQMPGAVNEFKNSVVLKRIGATRLKIWQFFLVLIFFYFILAVLAFFYVCLIAGILFATRTKELSSFSNLLMNDKIPSWAQLTSSSITEKIFIVTNVPRLSNGLTLIFQNNSWEYLFPHPDYIGQVIGFYMYFFVVMVLFGLAISSLVKRATTIQMVTTIIFFPTTFLVGGFVPPNLIAKSDVLGAMQYIFIHSKVMLGFTTFWRGEVPATGSKEFIELIGVSIGTGLGLIGIFSIIIKKFFKWND